MKNMMAILLVAVLGTALAQDQAPPPEKKVDQAKADAAAVAKANNAFACDLYAKLREKEGNLFFSPYNIHTALAMTYAGARGKTAEQIAATLHVDLPAERFHAAFGGLAKELGDAPKMFRDEPAYQLVISNALWVQKGYSFRKEFAALIDGNYRAELKEEEFSAPEGARKAINAWAEKATNDKAKDLLGPGALSDTRARLMLTSTIYFKSRWSSQFSKDDTKPGPFRLRLDGGKTVEVPLMTQELRANYMETDEFQIVSLPYESGALSMTVLLPRKADGLPALEKKLTANALDEWSKKTELAEVNLTLPRFKLAEQFGLNKTLGELGMGEVFDPNKADLSGMTTAEKLWLDDLVHEASVSVDEEGTEALARIYGRFFGGPVPEPPKLPKVTFRADRPFLFLIRHHSTGAVLFLGRVTNPGA